MKRALPLLIGLCGAAFGPVYAITATKLNVANTIATSTNQRVKIYGLPPLVLASPSSSYTTKPFDSLTYAPYPYSTSTSTQAIYKLSAGQILKGEYGSASFSTVDPNLSATVTDWAWYGGTAGTTRLGAVPDPSMSRQEGASSTGGVLQPTDWISLNVTFLNALKPVQITNGLPQGDLVRPSARLAYMDFGVGAYSAGKSRTQQVDDELSYSSRATKKINPNSQGQLAQAFDLQRSSSSPYLKPGQSVADDGNSATLFVAPVVPLETQQPPVPNENQAVTAHYIGSKAGVDGVDPRNSMRIQSNNRVLTFVELSAGASITFQIRVRMGAFELAPPFRPLVITRMRETTVEAGVEVTEALFSGVADFPRDLDVGAKGFAVPTGTVSPQDRQDWAHRLSLYNRSLRYYGGAAALRSGRF